MLFTQATEAGIAIENAIIIPKEGLTKLEIPANQKRILHWAKDNHVNIHFPLSHESNFNCFLGILAQDRMDEKEEQLKKKMLREAEKDLLEFIESLPAEENEANQDLLVSKEVEDLVNEFKNRLTDIIPGKAIVSLTIYKVV